jgi:hypothetical protein
MTIEMLTTLIKHHGDEALRFDFAMRGSNSADTRVAWRKHRDQHIEWSNALTDFRDALCAAFPELKHQNVSKNKIQPCQKSKSTK